jgi:hypothetical protein
MFNGNTNNEAQPLAMVLLNIFTKNQRWMLFGEGK